MRKSSKRSKKPRVIIFIAVALTVLLLIGSGLLLQSQQPQELPQTGELIVNFVDVGQGDSTFIILPSGETILIDAGESTASGTVIDSIKAAGIQSIDHIIATHPHSDHIGGMAALVDAFEVKNIWMPDVTHTTQAFERLLDAIDSNGLSISIAEAGTVLFNNNIDGGSLRAEFIAPVNSDYKDLNNYSAVLFLAYNDVSFLFMGDAEAESETEILALGRSVAADVIKIGHHGSSTSSTREFIAAVSPLYAVISCSDDNQYGHPHTETLSLFDEFDIDVLRTDIHGTITLSTDGENITYSVSNGG